MSTWTEEQREKTRVKERRRWATWSPEQKAKHRARNLAWYYRNKQQTDDRAYVRCAKMRYGLELEQLQSLVDRQAGICALCGKIPPQGKRRALHIDHDHATNKVRELLCHPCNRGLAYVENVEWLVLAQKYLDKHS